MVIIDSAKGSPAAGSLPMTPGPPARTLARSSSPLSKECWQPRAPSTEALPLTSPRETTFSSAMLLLADDLCCYNPTSPSQELCLTARGKPQPCRGRSLEERNGSKKSAAYRNACVIHKHWHVQVVINEWASGCWDANDMQKKSKHEWLNEGTNDWMNQSTTERSNETNNEWTNGRVI